MHQAWGLFRRYSIEQTATRVVLLSQNIKTPMLSAQVSWQDSVPHQPNARTKFRVTYLATLYQTCDLPSKITIIMHPAFFFTAASGILAASAQASAITPRQGTGPVYKCSGEQIDPLCCAGTVNGGQIAMTGYFNESWNRYVHAWDFHC